MHTGTSMPPARSRRTTETPSRSGIVTSRTMTAGGRWATASSASRPPAAVETAKPSRRSARSRACRTDASSSTTRTRGSGVAMQSSLGRKVLERRLHLRLVELEALRERGGERIAHALVLGLVGRMELLEGGLDLVGRDAEGLGELGGAVLAALGTVVSEVLAQRPEGGLELGLGDADRLREVRSAVLPLARARPTLGMQ